MPTITVYTVETAAGRIGTYWAAYDRHVAQRVAEENGGRLIATDYAPIAGTAVTIVDFTPAR